MGYYEELAGETEKIKNCFEHCDTVSTLVQKFRKKICGGNLKTSVALEILETLDFLELLVY